MIRAAALLFLLPILVACGEDEPAPAPPATAPGVTPVPEKEKAPRVYGPFALATEVGVPGRPPPVRVLGDARGVRVTYRKVADPVQHLNGDSGLDPVAKPVASGLYVVTAERGETRIERQFVISDLAVCVTRTRREILVFVADAATGTPVPSVDVHARADDESRTGRTDVSGVSRLVFRAPGDLKLLALRGDRVGYVEVPALPGGDLDTWLVLDRAAYEPGDEVRVAGLYRRQSGRPASAARARIEIRDRHGCTIAASDPIDHSPGVFYGRVRIPPDPPLGPLTLSVDLGEDVATRTLPMVEPAPAGFDARIETSGAGRIGLPHPFVLNARNPAGGTPAGTTVAYLVRHLREGDAAVVLEGRGSLGPVEGLGGTFTPEHPGTYRIEMQAEDRSGLKAVAERDVEVRGEVPTGGSGSLFRIESGAPSVEPGGRIPVAIHIPESLSESTLLVTVMGMGGRLGPHRVVPVESDVHRFTVTAPDQPGGVATLEAVAVTGRRVLRATAVVPIRSERLAVAVSVDPSPLVPGRGAEIRIDLSGAESARVVVAVNESRGKASKSERSTDRDSVTTHSLLFPDPAPVAAVGGHDFARDPPRRPSAPILWNAGVKLEGGRATLAFDPPLRPVRLNVLVAAIDAKGRVASAVTEIRWPVPTLELGVPRFLVVRDLCRLAPPGAGRIACMGGLTRVEEDLFSATAPPAGRVTAPSRDLPLLRETAGIAILNSGREMSSSRTVALRKGLTAPSAFQISSTARPGSAELAVLVTRGPFAAAVRAFESLPARSAGTSEGDLLRFLPAAVARASNADLADLAGLDGESVISAAAVATAWLYARQGPDGGFAPWDGAAPDPETTARVLIGLARARRAGIPVDEARIERAADWLSGRHGGEPARAMMILSSLADAGRKVATRALEACPEESLERLPPSAIARLLSILTRSGMEEEAAKLLPLLTRAARRDPAGHLYWADAPGLEVVTTAVVVSSLLAEPAGEVGDLVAEGVRTLIARRHGAGWPGTRESLAASLALLGSSGRLPLTDQPEAVRVRVGSELVAALTLDSEELASRGRAIVTGEPDLLRGRIPVVFEAGAGVDLDAALLLRWREDDAAPTKDAAVRVIRSVARVRRVGGRIETTPLDGPAAAGDALLVTVTVSRAGGTPALAVTCPLAGGTIALSGVTSLSEAVPTPPEGTGVRYRPDHVRFLLPAGGKGDIRLGFLVRTAFEGRFALRPVTVEGLDGGERLGVSEAGILYVR